MSLSYIDTVLSKTPALFYYLNMVGPATTGDVVTDLSPSGLDGAVGHSNGPEPYGYPSPIETDPLSREFLAHGDGTVFPTEVSRIARSNDALIQPTNDFAFEAWVRTVGGASSSPQPLCGKGSGNLLGDGANQTFFIGVDLFNARLVGAVMDSGGTRWDVVDSRIGGSAGDLLNGEAHHVVLVRQSNVLSIYTDGFLGGATTIASGLGNHNTTNDLYIGCPQTSPFDCRFAAVVLYTHYLSAADVLEVYESARARLPMYATINARSTFSPDLTPPPVYSAYPLRHNFDTPIVERLSRLTNVQQLKDGREERTGRATKTRRTISVDSLTPDALTRRKFSTFLWSNLRQPVAMPMVQDTVRLTADATAGDTVIYLDTQYRDFDDDSRIRLGTDSLTELAEIDSHDLTSVSLKDPLANDWAKGTRVAPAKLAYLEQGITIAGVTTEVESIKATGSILIEDIAAAPNRITAHTPTYTHEGVEVFNPFEWGGNDYNDPLDYQTLQQGEPQDMQTGIFAIDTSDVANAQQGLGAAFWLKGRDVISSFLGWYENRAGRLNKLWVPTMQADFDVVSVDATLSGSHNLIDVKNTDYQLNYNLDVHRRDICLVQLNRTLSLRRITAVAPSGGNERLTVDSSVAALGATTRQMCFLRMCRLDADELELVWHTADLVRVVFRFAEVLYES